MEPECLKIDVTDHVATVTLDRPPVNAMNGPLLEEIRQTGLETKSPLEAFELVRQWRDRLAAEKR